MKKEDILQQVVAHARGISVSEVQDTLSYIVIRDTIDERDWETHIPVEMQSKVAERIENKVQSFLEYWGGQIGKL